MAAHPIPVRLQHAWAVLSGRIILPAQLEQMELLKNMTDTATALTRASASLTRVLAKAQDAETAAQAAADLDAQNASALNALADQMDAYAPLSAADAGTESTIAA